MTADVRQQTARIYQFPVKPRAANHTTARTAPSATGRRLPCLPMTDFGGGWYHDAAIQNEPVSPNAG